MKKLLAFLLTLLLFATFSLSAFAANEETFVYEINGITIIFDEHGAFDAATREVVAHKLAHDNDDTDTYGLWCTLFGHDYEQSGVSTITHCAQSIQPRCLQEFFVVQVCTRCEDTIVDRTGLSYITCCP